MRLDPLQVLRLNRNQVGDVGMQALASAVASGAMALEWLDLNSNQIGDAGLAALARAITPVSAGGSGALASAKVCAYRPRALSWYSRTVHLDPWQVVMLDSNRIGDAGISKLASALAEGRWRWSSFT